MGIDPSLDLTELRPSRLAQTQLARRIDSPRATNAISRGRLSGKPFPEALLHKRFTRSARFCVFQARVLTTGK
jgi:hypothetical protein